MSYLNWDSPRYRNMGQIHCNKQSISTPTIGRILEVTKHQRCDWWWLNIKPHLFIPRQTAPTDSDANAHHHHHPHHHNDIAPKLMTVRESCMSSLYVTVAPWGHRWKFFGIYPPVIISRPPHNNWRPQVINWSPPHNNWCPRVINWSPPHNNWWPWVINWWPPYNNWWPWVINWWPPYNYWWPPVIMWWHRDNNWGIDSEIFSPMSPWSFRNMWLSDVCMWSKYF